MRSSKFTENDFLKIYWSAIQPYMYRGKGGGANLPPYFNIAPELKKVLL